LNRQLIVLWLAVAQLEFGKNLGKQQDQASKPSPSTNPDQKLRAKFPPHIVMGMQPTGSCPFHRPISTQHGARHLNLSTNHTALTP
jgi:hypothetical protein